MMNAKKDGSLVSRVKVFKRPIISVIYPTHPSLVSRSLSEIWSVSGSFYHEWHEWTNDTNLLCFNIRKIRSNVSFVIPKHLMPHRHDSSCEMPGIRELTNIQKDSGSDYFCGFQKMLKGVDFQSLRLSRLCVIILCLTQRRKDAETQSDVGTRDCYTREGYCHRPQKPSEL